MANQLYSVMLCLHVAMLLFSATITLAEEFLGCQRKFVFKIPLCLGVK